MILTPQTNFKGFDLDLFLEENKNSDETTGLLIIFPTNRRMREFKKFLARSFPLVNVSVTTIRSLAMKLAMQIQGGYSIIPDELHDIFINEIINNILINKENTPPKPAKGVYRLIKNTISEFKENGTDQKAFLQKLNDLNPLFPDKAELLAEVWEKLDEKFRKEKLAEVGDVYIKLQTFREKIPVAFKEIFPEVNQIFMQNFFEITSPEAIMIAELATAVNNKIFLEFNYSDANPYLFEKIDKIVNLLLGEGFQRFRSKEESVEPPFHTHIREFLFNPNKKEKLNAGEIFDIQGNDLYHEVTLVVKEIKRLLIEDPSLQASEIGVLFQKISVFTPWVRAIFDSYGIPVNITDRYRTSDFPSVTALLDLLSIPEKSFSYDSVLRVLSFDFFRKRYGNPEHFKLACSNIGIGRDYTRLRKHLKRKISELEKELQNSYKKPKETIKKAEAEKEILVSALNMMEIIYNDIQPLLKPQTLEEFALAFKEFLISIGYFSHFADGRGGNALFNIRALSSFYKAALKLFEISAQHDEADIKTYPEHLEILREIAAETRFNLIEQPETGVMISTPNEVRGLKFKHLFICALNDGDFPTRYKPAIFKYDGVLDQIKKHSADERMLFYQAISTWMATPSSHLYLSNCKRSGDKENVQSYFKREVLALFETKKLEPAHYDNLIYNRREIWEKGEFEKVDNFSVEEIRDRKRDYEIQCNLNGDNTDSAFAGYISFDYEDDLGLGQRIIERINKFPFSATSLERYARCPYQFFVNDILNASSSGSPSEELDPILFGTILHQLLEAFHNKLKANRKHLAGSSEKELNGYLNDLIEIAKKPKSADESENSKDSNDSKNSKKLPDWQLEDFLETESFLAAEKILGIAGDPKKSILWKYLELESKENRPLTPDLFEENFNNLKLTGKTSDDRPKTYDINIMGKIDRIDTSEENGEYKIIDYKSGKNSYNQKDLDEGYLLQIPIYLLASVNGAVSSLKNPKEYLFPRIFSLKYKEGEFGTNDILLKVKKGSSESTYIETHRDAEEKWGEYITKTEDIIKNLVLGIYEGNFPLTDNSARGSKFCSFCTFQPICRVQAHRISKESTTQQTTH